MIDKEQAFSNARKQRDELRENAIGLRNHANNLNSPRSTRDIMHRFATSMERAADTITALIDIAQFGV